MGKSRGRREAGTGQKAHASKGRLVLFPVSSATTFAFVSNTTPPSADTPIYVIQDIFWFPILMFLLYNQTIHSGPLLANV
jgi:hypothetical protein